MLQYALRRVVLALAIGLAWVGCVARIVRATMLEALGETCIRTARAFGLPPSVVIYRYALRVALTAVSIPGLIGLVPGMIAGFGPRWLDNALLVVFDRLRAYPHELSGGQARRVGPVTAPLVPVFLGISEVPPEHGPHRYLTSSESARFLDARHADRDPDTISHVPQGAEVTRSAFAIHKRLMHLAFQMPDPLLAETFAHWPRTEAALAAKLPDVLESTAILLEAGAERLALRLLTRQPQAWVLSALDEAEALVAAAEVRVRNRGAPNMSLDPMRPVQLWQPRHPVTETCPSESRSGSAPGGHHCRWSPRAAVTGPPGAGSPPRAGRWRPPAGPGWPRSSEIRPRAVAGVQQFRGRQQRAAALPQFRLAAKAASGATSPQQESLAIRGIGSDFA